jgi:hypothetical protein
LTANPPSASPSVGWPAREAPAHGRLGRVGQREEEVAELALRHLSAAAEGHAVGAPERELEVRDREVGSRRERERRVGEGERIALQPEAPRRTAGIPGAEPAALQREAAPSPWTRRRALRRARAGLAEADVESHDVLRVETQLRLAGQREPAPERALDPHVEAAVRCRLDLGNDPVRDARERRVGEEVRLDAHALPGRRPPRRVGRATDPLAERPPPR